MRLSISITDYSRLDTLDAIAAAADEAGVDTVWVPDHLMQAAPGSDPDGPMLEAYTALGYLAARTRRVRLGTLVTAVTYRPFAIVAKAVETVGRLSGGRAWLGLGAATTRRRRSASASHSRRSSSASTRSRRRWEPMTARRPC